ncbi:hypothetical protein CXF72_11775 [Psychromonas sp. MB-3u-54]|uniref:DUF3316 domain-containing protein n=1 Tax=Psychromonas sp. MB-3u-54 TaxID=2058319 RepID=UPI000C338059|nr:DUF3316 domain-containing protein [Psychromonas sp. MB-3u-54]PKH02407.1 hypothetical protein CXF72_11775 [Psychromonas sp. MB-3u-54]
MNTMTKALVMALSLFLFGANAYAANALPGYSHAIVSKTLHVTEVDTKDEAYSLGFQKLQNLMKMQSGASLSDALVLLFADRAERQSVTYDEANVTVQEFMDEQGEIVYKGMVNVTYHYSVKSD